MKDLVQDVAEDVLGAVKGGIVKVLIVKVFILPIAICQLRTHATLVVGRRGGRIVICQRRYPRNAFP